MLLAITRPAQNQVEGVKASYNMQVSEPEPGRVLREEDRAAGVVTTFTVDAVERGAQSRVTIATTGRTRSGISRWLDKWMNPPIMRRIYGEELAQLDAVAKHGL